MAVCTPQETARHEEHDPEPRSVIARSRFVRVHVPEGALVVLIVDRALVGSVGRNPEPQIVPAAGFESANVHRFDADDLYLTVEGAADHVPLLLLRQPDEVDCIA